jgi:hypothetical protein
MSTDLPDPREAGVLVDLIGPILHGQNPVIQGAALADLFAMWIAGHFDTEGHTAELREQIIADWMHTVRRLIPVNERMILERNRRDSH